MLRRRYDLFIAEVPKMKATNGIVAFHQDGLQLAGDLRNEALRLRCSRAYEYSPDIYWLAQAAATGAFLLAGSQSPVFLECLQDVLYYKSFEATRDRVESFLRYTKGNA
jgi:hypothetical protein